MTTYEPGETKLCPHCGEAIKHGGFSPGGDEEWFHVDSLTNIDCAVVL